MIRSLVLLFAVITSTAVFAQEQKSAQEQKPSPPPTFKSPSARLAEAKTAYARKGDGSEVPFNVIEGGLEGWGRFIMVDSPQKADIIIEVTAPTDNRGISVSSSTENNGKKTSSTSLDLTVEVIKMVVTDAKTHIMLWSGTERPKGAFKDKNKMDNLVEASGRLLAQFRDRLEPPPAATAK